MKKKYNNYIKAVNNLCQLDDYSNSKKVSENNKNEKYINDIQNLFLSNIKEYSDMILELLENDNENIKLNISIFCYRNNIHYNVANGNLKSIYKKTNNKYHKFLISNLFKNSHRS